MECRELERVTLWLLALSFISGVSFSPVYSEAAPCHALSYSHPEELHK